MNKFTCVLLLGTALLAGCVDREGYYNSVREEDSHVRRYSLIPAVCLRVL